MTTMQDLPEPTAIEAVRDFVAHPSTERALYVIGFALTGVAGWFGAGLRAGKATRVAHADLAGTLAALERKIDARAEADTAAHRQIEERVAKVEGMLEVLVLREGRR